MRYSITKIFDVLGLDASDINSQHFDIRAVSIDSRQISSARHTLFFALPGAMSDGHLYICKAYDRGVRNFVISEATYRSQFDDANYLLVEDVLRALQDLATYHRASFPNLKKIGITGSNGKTIVKEWLYQMLHDKYTIVKSPKSYNSQIGMALSLLAIEDYHELGIFEAGISQKGEMISHHRMLQPDIGIFTNLGSAHSEGFDSEDAKAREKLILFRSSETIIYRKDFPVLYEEIMNEYHDKDLMTWATFGGDIDVYMNQVDNQYRRIAFKYKKQSYVIEFHLIDLPSFENIMTCITVLLHLGIPPIELQERISRVSGLKMRLEMQAGVKNSILVNDAYSADIDSYAMAVEFLRQHAPARRRLAIVSAFDQSDMNEAETFERIIYNSQMFHIHELLYISENQFDIDTLGIDVKFYPSKQAVIDDLDNIRIENKGVLIKGARKYELEDIIRILLEKSHTAELSIDLNAIDHNLRQYKKHLNSETGIIAVVKASAYGSGSEEIARLLEASGVDYLAVAFADEGISLRLAGIKTPIMVLNPDMNALPEIFRYRLEPEIYSLDQMERMVSFSKNAHKILPIHIKLDTGMHRLGLQEQEIEKLNALLSSANNIEVKTIFSHLASSEDISDDDYTKGQFQKYDQMYSQLTSIYKSKNNAKLPKKHILNSGGISRFPNHQYDFVRLGIGLYGIDSNPDIGDLLQKAHRLSASLIQIKNLSIGDSVGYNRKTTLKRNTKVGIVNIGYADGVMRCIGKGRFTFLINGHEASILGNVCMDLTIVDLSDVPNPMVGDSVVIFDQEHSIESMAKAADTIPYEILSRISSRVQRKYIRE